MPLEPVIGLEIHVQLTTKSKMFCSCANVFGEVEPNSAVCPICMGYPGTLPVPNKTAIEWVRKAGVALNCELATKSKFDRKSYFYPDLPKGYQISQYDQPFCGKGQLGDVGITRIHLEEDAAKNSHSGDSTLIDFNRAGTPLIEIVTEPDIKTPEQAKDFLQELQRTMRALKISDADMEKGMLRCDANISLREAGTEKLNPKVEVKNLNSFRHVERALKYEIDRQAKEWEKGNIPKNETRGWDADKQKTVSQRTKEEAADYRYFPEPDIPPFEFTAEENEAVKRELPELPAATQERFVRQFGISAEQAVLLSENSRLAEFFEETVSELWDQDQERLDIQGKDVKKVIPMAANMILRDVRKLLEDDGQITTSPENFAELVLLLHQGKMNKEALPQMLAEMERTGGDPDAILKNFGLEQVSETGELNQYIDTVIAEHPEVIEKIRAGKTEAIQFLVGQVMAKTKGKAKADLVRQLLQDKLG